MKKLFLVRHAKSSWGDPNATDRHRGLNKRGKRDAPKMGARLAERDIEIDRMISSPATRALDTAEIFVRSLDHPWDELIIEEQLYLANAEEILEIIHNQPGYLDQIMVIGHNPGMTDLINILGTSYIGNLPTCGIYELTYKLLEWSQIGDVPPEVECFDYPKKK